jgi:hypothetical protein
MSTHVANKIQALYPAYQRSSSRQTILVGERLDVPIVKTADQMRKNTKIPKFNRNPNRKWTAILFAKVFREFLAGSITKLIKSCEPFLVSQFSPPPVY